VRIAIDTNVLVRYLTWDDPVQAAAATKVIEDAEVIAVSTIVLCEVVWALKRAYRYDRTEIARAIRGVIESRNVEADRPAAEAGLAMLIRGGDFANGVVQYDAKRGKCNRLVTFDRAFGELAGEGVVVLTP
jgi:predicted nucleic-acid-binding protein